MEVLNICKNYFNGFEEASNFRKNDSTTNVLAVLKVLSYFTVVIPLGFAIAYGAASLIGRVSKKQDLSSQDKNIHDTAKTTLLKNDSPTKAIPFPTVESNSQLAEKIIAARGENDKYVKSICSGDFLVDPIAHLLREMIERGVGKGRRDDNTRAFIIGQIPGFIEKVSSPGYLRSFAEIYFKNNPNINKIMPIFEKSLVNEEFQKHLTSAAQQFKSVQGEDFNHAENALRIPLTIFHQSASLMDYSYPTEGNQEMMRRS